MNYKFIITGGGTSGHINPAISIADAITQRCKQQGDNCDIIFTGREKGLENELVSKAGYEMILDLTSRSGFSSGNAAGDCVKIAGDRDPVISA